MTKEKAQTVLDCLRIMIPILEEAVGFEYKTPCCKDCKHKCVKGKTTQHHYCEIWKSAVDETDFCSRGVKR